MTELIRLYEESRDALQQRIHELNVILKNKGSLLGKERELLLQRRELLTIERTEMLHILQELHRHQ